MTALAIRTSGLTRRFGALTAVAGLDLAVPVGAVYGFLGPNGAGKSTTIRMLLGLIRPDAGEVRLFDTPLTVTRRDVLRRVGALVEDPSLYPHLTGRENLEVTRRLLGAGRERVQTVLRTVGLEEAADRKVAGYSRGMQQRLGLALALLGGADLLILDEPTNGLDPAGIREMRDLVRWLPQERGATVLLSSHLLSEVEQMATHIGIIQAGRMLFQGKPSELQARLHEHVALGVTNRDLAEQTLARAGWGVEPGGNGHIRIAANGESDAALINSQLNAAGVGVYHVGLERPSLEDIFLTLTTGEAAPSAVAARS